MKVSEKAKVLYIDIETSPLVCLTWGMWEVNVAKLLEDTYILSAAYQWEGEPMWFLKSESKQNDEKLCKQLQSLFNEANVIIAQNGDQFDIKRINARFAYWKLEPPPPYKTIDTLKLLKKHFGLTKNSLDFVCQYFKIGKKKKHHGIDLWDNCMNDPNHPDWKVMEVYNKHDVWLLRQLWLRVLKKWHRTAPRTEYVCGSCKSSHGMKHGFRWRKGVMYQKWQCKDCGATTMLDIKK